MMVRFDWQEDKDKRNRKKHKIGFDIAKMVFDDPLAKTRHDRTKDYEYRWHTIGQVGNFTLLVVHTEETYDDHLFIKIISSRKATPHERQKYEEGTW